jgi:ribonuclease PH
MNNRGDHVMGFDHDKTTHHFTLTKNGGVIQVTANDSTDSISRDHIRMHLQHISKAFAMGDFDNPMEVHSEIPPGVQVMKERKNKISYRFESIADGGRVVIKTEDTKALAAVHEYLQYQIREHKTGDPETVQ